MASVVFFTIATYAGTAAGYTAATVAVVGAVASAAGAVIDSMFLYPALSPTQGQTGPRLLDRQVQTGSEGSPMKYVLGRARVAGTVIWSSGIQEISLYDSTGKGGGGSNDYYKYYTHLAIGVCEGSVNEIEKIWADSRLIYDTTNPEAMDPLDHRVCDWITVHNGDGTQSPDALVQGVVGPDKTPGYRRLCYVVINRLRMDAFGRRIPNFTFQVRQSDNPTVADCVKALCLRAGLLEAQVDVSRVSGRLHGMQMAGPTSLARALEPILLAYDVTVQESNGVLRFLTYGMEQQIAVSGGDLFAHEDGDSQTDAPRPFRLTDSNEFDLPKQVNVNFIDVFNNYQQGSNSHRTVHLNKQTQTETVDLPLALSGYSAKAIAAKRMWRRYAERFTVLFHLPPTYIGIEENDVALLPYKGNVYPVRVTQVDQGNNYLLEIQGRIIDPLANMPSGLATNCFSGPAPDPVYQPGDLYLSVMDTEPLRDSDATSGGVYFAVSRVSTHRPYGGAVVYLSTDNVTWSAVTGSVVECPTALAPDALANGPTGLWDDRHTLTVNMMAGTLESVTDADVLSGKNWMKVGNEIIAFANATLTGDGTYRLSRLLRGLRGTEAYTSSHQPVEVCTLLTPVAVGRALVTDSFAGTRIFLKAVPMGGTMENYYSQPVDFKANTERQLPPCHVRCFRVAGGSGDVTFTWQRRSRNLYRVLSPSPALLLTEVGERYELEIAISGSAWRTVTGLTSPSYTYVAADQAADGNGIMAPYTVRVYQMGNTGRGLVEQVTVEAI